MPSPTPLTSLPRRLALAIAALAAFAAATAAPALASDPGTSVVLDQPSGFTDPLTGAGNFNLPRSGGAVSADGRYVVFASASDGLSAADDDALLNVFRKDRQTSALELVSVSSAGRPANGDSYAVGISDDGNRVLFMQQRRVHLGLRRSGDVRDDRAEPGRRHRRRLHRHRRARFPHRRHGHRQRARRRTAGGGPRRGRGARRPRPAVARRSLRRLRRRARRAGCRGPEPARLLA